LKGKMLDLYERWEQSGQLESKLSAIKEMISKRAHQKEVAEYLGISEKTLIKLKKVHPKINRAFEYGNEEMKDNIFDALLKRAVGYDYEETQTTLEETKTGTKKKIVKTKKHYPPDISAAKYLLPLHFGVEYSERRFEIEAMNKRLEKGEEVWTNEYSDEEALGVVRIRKQSKK